jgi:hypothetical protein
VFVLHAFQKKAKSGVATPKPDIDLITQRFRVAPFLTYRVDLKIIRTLLEPKEQRSKSNCIGTE